LPLSIAPVQWKHLQLRHKLGHQRQNIDHQSGSVRSPLLPPVTSSSGRLGSNPNAWSGRLRHPSVGIAGAPACQSLFGSLAVQSGSRFGKPTNDWLVTHESQQFARPGIVLDSCKKVGTPERPAGQHWRRAGEPAHRQGRPRVVVP